jgi:hypothetical protein
MAPVTSCEDSNPVNFARLLRTGSGRRGEEADRETDREPDPPHRHLVGGWLAGV